MFLGLGLGIGETGGPKGAAASLSLDFTSSIPAGVTVNSSPVGYAPTASGLLQAFTANTGRRTDLGLLVEPAATNLHPNSTDTETLAGLSGATWSSNTETTPAGVALAADKLVENTATSIHRFDSGGVATVTNGSWYTSSWYFKPDVNRQFWRCRISQNRAVGFTYDITNGSLSALTGTSDGTNNLCYVQNLGSGWFRFVAPFLSNALTVGSYLGPYGTATVQSFTGDGVSGATMWGLQVEAGQNVVTSPIDTTAAAASRTADDISFTIPAGISTLRYTFDDNSTQDVSVSPGAYAIPTTLNRPQIKTIVGS